MKNRISFCTVISSDYIPFSKTLFQSIKRYDSFVDCYALIIGENLFEEDYEFFVLRLEELSESNLVNEIKNKYENQQDALRWSLKSLLLMHLLEYGGYDQVFFVDPDLYFFSDFRFLYNELGENSFLLSPHWGCMHPNISELYFHRLMTDGLYNAGFLGATSKGLNTLKWWAENCNRACERDKMKGLYDDQAYLNLFPILSPDSKTLTHRGCNVAEWNRFEVSRSLDENGDLILDEHYPLVFIHFSNLSYLVENDPLLVPYLEKYNAELARNGFKGNLVRSAESFIKRERLKELTLLERLFRRIIGKDRFAQQKDWGK